MAAGIAYCAIGLISMAVLPTAAAKLHRPITTRRAQPRQLYDAIQSSSCAQLSECLEDQGHQQPSATVNKATTTAALVTSELTFASPAVSRFSILRCLTRSPQSSILCCSLHRGPFGGALTGNCLDEGFMEFTHHDRRQPSRPQELCPFATQKARFRRISDLSAPIDPKPRRGHVVNGSKEDAKVRRTSQDIRVFWFFSSEKSFFF
jgi:hypothetical protein